MTKISYVYFVSIVQCPVHFSQNLLISNTKRWLCSFLTNYHYQCRYLGLLSYWQLPVTRVHKQQKPTPHYGMVSCIATLRQPLLRNINIPINKKMSHYQCCYALTLPDSSSPSHLSNIGVHWKIGAYDDAGFEYRRMSLFSRKYSNNEPGPFFH